MAVRRTDTIDTAKKPRFKQPSALSIFGKILETTGRPVFWLGLGAGYFLLTIFFLTGKITISIGKIIFRLLKKLPVLFLKGTVFVSRLLSTVVNLISPLVYRLTRLRFPKIKLPKLPKIPEISLPRLRVKVRRVKIVFPRPTKKWLLPITAICLLVFICLFAYLLIFKDLPHPNRLITRPQIVSTKIYDRNGELLYKIYRSQNRTLVKLEDIPVSLVQATIAIEDAEFYQHYGFSIKAIIRSFFRNLRGGKLYGGSTITQQLVKNALLSAERTLRRKIREVILAFGVEVIFSKDEILQMYFNEVGYGGAAYGTEEATQMYFGKSVRDLSLAESALLAGLPASPTYSPFGAHPEKAKERQILVLRRMREEKFITRQQEQEAKTQELHFAPQRTDIKAPHFVMYVKELLVKKYELKMVEEGGLEIKTSLDLNLQNQVQKIVAQEIEKLANLRINNGAALVTNPKTGEILAMVGSRDYFDLENDGNVNVTLRPRQPGSAIKPVNYSLALENGFTAATPIPDTPITYRLPGQPDYSPRNYDGRFHGNPPLRVALASSYNVPAVKVLSALGVGKMVKRGQEMGITTWEDPTRFGLSLTLGGGEVKMIDMAVVYGTLANLGMRVDLNPILEVKNYKGETLEKNGCGWETSCESEAGSGDKEKRVLPPNIAYILTDILSDNSARAPAFGPNSILNIPQHPHVAVKTGTTQNLRDNWTIGYTPDYLVAVWVGNNDNTPMSYVASGVTGASPIWQQIMTNLLKDIPDKEFSKPENLVQVEICPLTNTLPCNSCSGKYEYFLPGTEPKNHCIPKRIKEILEKEKEEKLE